MYKIDGALGREGSPSELDDDFSISQNSGNFTVCEIGIISATKSPKVDASFKKTDAKKISSKHLARLVRSHVVGSVFNHVAIAFLWYTFAAL